jgi:hypothetical protein
VTYETKEGQQRTGDFELDFDARGFEAGCNSLQAPRLTLKPKETYSNGASKGGSNGGASSGSGAGSKSKPAPDSREHDQGEDAPVPPPDQSGYAK